MDWHLLTDIEFAPDEARFLAEMRLKPGSRHVDPCLALVHEVRAVARPRALLLTRRVEQLDESGMVVAGTRLHSSLFAPRLREGQYIYPFLATAGAELDTWRDSYRADRLLYYWAACLAEMALQAALSRLETELTPLMGDGYAASFNPGSLAAWPLTQQKPLFDIIGSGASAIGVMLTEECQMRPVKSVSGLFFRSATAYYNCQLCPRQGCAKRRANYEG